MFPCVSSDLLDD